MDILGHIIQCTQPPLSEPLLNSVFPVVVNTILASDDNSVLQVEFAFVLNVKPFFGVLRKSSCV